MLLIKIIKKLENFQNLRIFYKKHCKLRKSTLFDVNLDFTPPFLSYPPFPAKLIFIDTKLIKIYLRTKID